MNNKDSTLHCLSLQDTLNNILIDLANDRDYKTRLKGYKVTLNDKFKNVNDSIDKIINFKSMY